MQLSDFSYELPPDLIAQEPLPERSASRLLVLEPDAAHAGGAGAGAGAACAGVSGDGAAFRDAMIRDLPGLLAPGDLLVFNDTRVVAARLVGRKPTGGRVELLLERAFGACEALVQMRASKSIHPGLEIGTAGGTVEVLEAREDLWRVRLPQPALDFFERWGEVPLPPYIRRAPSAADRDRYQSLFARESGAVAAPTASLHFDEPLLAALAQRGIGRAFVTLHVGAGTFQPIRAADPSQHVMHSERVSVSEATWEAIGRTRAAGGRIIAVGTTVVRALEAAAMALEPPAPEAAVAREEAVARVPGASAAGAGAPGAAAPSAAAPDGAAQDGAAPADAAPLAGRRVAWSGDTRLFITPGFRFRVVEGLVTNFHLPQSTLLMLVAALAGRERVLDAYAHAVRSRYRFFSYGDAMLVMPARRTPAHAAAI